MDARELFLSELRAHCRNALAAESDGFTWDDVTFLRVAILRLQQGDRSAWNDWIDRLRNRPGLVNSVRRVHEESGLLYSDWGSGELKIGGIPDQVTPLSEEDANEFLNCLTHPYEDDETDEELPTTIRPSRTEIMFIENKGDGLSGPARIGRVTFSKSRKTIYYAGRKLQTLKGSGYKANYFDVDNGDHYWISRCRRDGRDTLYGGVVEIDEDVREIYWREVRQREDLINQTSYRCSGKH